MKLWAGFLWLSSYSHWPLCRALGGIGWLLFGMVVWFLLPELSCTTAWSPVLPIPLNLWLHEVVFISLFSKPVPHPCQSLWDREATGCRWLLLHVFMCLRVLDDSEYLSASIQIPYHLQRIPISPLSAVFSTDLENPSGHKPQQGTQLVLITMTSIC